MTRRPRSRRSKGARTVRVRAARADHDASKPPRHHLGRPSVTGSVIAIRLTFASRARLPGIEPSRRPAPRRAAPAPVEVGWAWSVRHLLVPTEL